MLQQAVLNLWGLRVCIGLVVTVLVVKALTGTRIEGSGACWYCGCSDTGGVLAY